MSGTLVILIVIVAAVLLVGIPLIVIYNRLVSLRQHVRDAWASIDVELRRRYDLIPNLVETVKGYAGHESETLENVVRLRNQAMANHGSVESQAKDEAQLLGALRGLNVVVEQYPQLKADANFRQLQDQLTNTEDRLAAARRFYNGNVREINQVIRMFPSNIVAGMFSFTPEDYFEVEDESVRAAPQVSF